MHAKNSNDDLRHNPCTFEITITDSNDIHPNTFNHGLTPYTRFDKTDRKIIFRSMASSFSNSFSMKLLGSFVVKNIILQCKMLRKEEKLAEVTFLNSKSWEMKYVIK